MLAMLGEFTEAQRRRIVSTPSDRDDLSKVTALIEARFSSEVHCPHCQSLEVGSWGRTHGLKRYRCRCCRKTFNALAGTPLARLRKRENWKTYAQALTASVSVRKATVRSGISAPTAFRWRHRFLTRLKDVKAKVVSDGADAYASFSAETGIDHVGLATSRGERRRGVFHIQNVNAYRSRLKGWMRRFNGVGTKYLISYLVWRRLFEREGDDVTALGCCLAATA